jgi:GDP-L-fucose synthase
VVTLWGTGTPRREFLHSDDAASAILHLVEHYDGDEHVNVGTGEDISIRDLAILVADCVGYSGEIQWDATKPDGTPRKLLDVSLLAARGWRSSIPLTVGVRSTYAWFTSQR